MSETVRIRLVGNGWNEESFALSEGDVVTAEGPDYDGDYKIIEGPMAGWYVFFDPKNPVSDRSSDMLRTGEILTDDVNHPTHYTSDPSGVECIQITRHRNFNIGNAIKYLWRNGLKDESGMGQRDKQIQDLEKAIFYIQDEISRIRSREVGE